MAKLSARGRYTVAEATWTGHDGWKNTRRLMSDNNVLHKSQHEGWSSGWNLSYKSDLSIPDWIAKYRNTGWNTKLLVPQHVIG